MSILDRFRLDGKRALVTGGSRGLGFCIAQALAEAGADLVLVSRDADQLAAARNNLRLHGGKVDAITADFEHPDEVAHACTHALAEFGPIHVLVNNVGGRRIDVPTENLELDDWQRILDFNLTSAFLCCKHIGGAMVHRQSGRIINVGSIAGLVVPRGIRGRAYETAKGALTAFTRALAADWASHQVTVNAILPGVFLTEPIRRWFERKPELRQTFLDAIPLARFGSPDEIGPLALFLASDAASYVTGAAFTIDGGYTLW